MSASIGYQRTEKCNWIPRSFSILAVLAAIVMAWAPARAFANVEEAPVQQRADTAWENWILIIIQELLDQMNCAGTELPPDVPVAMLVTVDCYESGGLLPMTLLDRLAFMALLDEAELAVKLAPADFPEDVRRKFLGAVGLMREEVQVIP